MKLSEVVISAHAAAKLRNGYPWVFANQVQSWESAPDPGALAAVKDPAGHLVGYGYANPKTPLCLRMLYTPAAGQRGPEGEPDERAELFRKLDRAWSRRRELNLDSDALRLVWSEADGLPGVVCDRLGSVLVLQLLTAGAQARRALIVEWLSTRLKPLGIYERSGGAGPRQEGLEPVTGWAWLPAGATAPETRLTITEGPLRFAVDIAAGQKTGFYLDQRPARRFIRSRKWDGPALDCFCYSGGFALSARWAGAAPVTAVDTSAAALELFSHNARLNGLEHGLVPVRSQVLRYLQAAAARGESYALITLDPPAFARRKNHVPEALQAYDRLHAAALRVLRPGGTLLTCACTHWIGGGELTAGLLRTVRAAGRKLKGVRRFGPDLDHPERMQAPESRYLSCVCGQVE